MNVKFARAGSNWSTQKGWFLHENTLRLESRGLLDCFHRTHHFSQNEAHVTTRPEALANNATGVHSVHKKHISSRQCKKKNIPKIPCKPQISRLTGGPWQSYWNKEWVIFLCATTFFIQKNLYIDLIY